MRSSSSSLVVTAASSVVRHTYAYTHARRDPSHLPALCYTHTQAGHMQPAFFSSRAAGNIQRTKRSSYGCFPSSLLSFLLPTGVPRRVWPGRPPPARPRRRPIRSLSFAALPSSAVSNGAETRRDGPRITLVDERANERTNGPTDRASDDINSMRDVVRLCPFPANQPTCFNGTIGGRFRVPPSPLLPPGQVDEKKKYKSGRWKKPARDRSFGLIRATNGWEAKRRK